MATLTTETLRTALCDADALPDECVQLVRLEADWLLVAVAFAVIVIVSLAALVISGMRR